MRRLLIRVGILVMIGVLWGSLGLFIVSILPAAPAPLPRRDIVSSLVGLWRYEANPNRLGEWQCPEVFEFHGNGRWASSCMSGGPGRKGEWTLTGRLLVLTYQAWVTDGQATWQRPVELHFTYSPQNGMYYTSPAGRLRNVK